MAKCGNALKVIFNYDNARTRIVYVDLVPNYNEFLKSLQSYERMENVFKYWIDDDNDKVEIKGDKSYKMFMKIATKKRIFVDYGKKTIEKQINIASSSSREPKSYVSLDDVEIHEQVECNVCKLFPILGLRYKCVICPDYDLCMACKNKCYHNDHKMMRISSKQDYLFALKELEFNNKEENISQSLIVNNTSLNPEMELISRGNLLMDKKPASLEEIAIDNYNYSILNELINNKNSTKNDFPILVNQPTLMINKEISSKYEILMNLITMFSKISRILGNKINIDSEIIKSFKMLPKQLTLDTTYNEKDYEGVNITNQEGTYNNFAIIEILNIFNTMFSKISDALGPTIDINNEITENHNILKIEKNENHLHHSNVFLEILSNFNEMFSKIFNALDLEHNHNTEESINKLNISTNYDSVKEENKLLKEEELKKPTLNYARLSRSLYKDDNFAKSLNENEMDKSLAEIIALGYENEDGWIENLLQSFNGDVDRAKDFLKPLNETFD